MKHSSPRLFAKIARSLNEIDSSGISAERKKVLQVLGDFIQQKVNSKEEINLNFICTHNSRRSHLCQAWAQAISAYFEIPKLSSYSGGTEATALFPGAAKSLEAAGFQIQIISKTANPVYSIKFGPNELPVTGFSKTFDHPFNPESNFAAIMTCSRAEAECPYISGAEVRIPVSFEDPKKFDNTPQQDEKYNERSLQIATELFYVFSKIKLK